jgi:hypothetical protein
VCYAAACPLEMAVVATFYYLFAISNSTPELDPRTHDDPPSLFVLLLLLLLLSLPCDIYRPPKPKDIQERVEKE